MKCPHCRVTFHDDPTILARIEDEDGTWSIEKRVCAACARMILHLEKYDKVFRSWKTARMLHPQGTSRDALDPAVLPQYSSDFNEAAAVLTTSSKASAALSRRCLQNVIHNHFKIKKRNLEEEIDALIPLVPSHVAESLDAVRVIGNFAAHPLKSTASGSIVEVEPHEAEWNLDTLELLFDFCFVQPKLAAAKKAALNAKLTAAGKPTIA